MFIESGESISPWFRGTGSQSHKLVPGLYRFKDRRDDMTDDELRTEFMRRALPLVAERAPRNDWEWYFLMQHYRAPTRLLDWTDAALVAIYFALAAYASSLNTAPSKTTPVVWALNPFGLNSHAKVEGLAGIDWSEVSAYLPVCYSGKRLPKEPVALDPILVDRRMLVQHSHFTVHGGDAKGIDEIEDLIRKQALLRVVIKFDEWELGYWQWQLGILGMRQTTIFPDLEGLARELRMEYFLD